MELTRPDNDVPTQFWQENSEGVRVLFQGHDGVFRLGGDHPELARFRALLDEAIRHQARVWFVAQKPDLSLLDVLPAGWMAAASPTNQAASLTVAGAPAAAGWFS